MLSLLSDELCELCFFHNVYERSVGINEQLSRNNEGPSSCAGHQGGATTAPVPTCYSKTRLPSYSIRFLASQHFNTDNSLHQCRAFILFLDVSTMRTFVYQFVIALRDAKVLAIPCAADKTGSRSTPNA